MDDVHALEDGYGSRLIGSPRDTTIQIIISVALGIGAFLAFCILRPRWPGLYAARKKQKDEATLLPDLPDTLFGWILPLWRITDQQVLASGGLDAYVFLAFFKMAIKFLAVTLFFSLVVIKPVHDSFPDDDAALGNKTHKHNDSDSPFPLNTRRSINLLSSNSTIPWLPENLETDYLWMYVVFAYLFSGLAIYLIISETRRIIEVRQEYLGSQTTVTDRTIRLSGIPSDLQDEQKIKDFVESLDIGKVESVTLCKNWKELDDAMVSRMDTLRRLEEAYTVHLGHRTVERNLESLPISQPAPPGPLIDGDEDGDEGETSGLMGNGHSQPHIAPYARVRPQTAIRYGRFQLHSKQVDAIDYYEEKLRQMDEKITELRKKDFPPTPLAFVTMDSVAACQMAVQAVLDPSPLQLIANLSPSPSDVVWPNTYMPRRSRMARAWSITALIVVLTLFWSIILVPVAGALNTDTIGRIFPQLARVLDDHPNIKSLVQTQLPTLIISLLNVLVPYFYDWLANCQGMISQGDVELSTISKNFFFVFFNFFVVFTVLGTASNFYKFFQDFGDALKDTRRIAYTLAISLQRLLTFYVNFIILQGLGLFPFRLLEFGSVATYPVILIGAKTPRDYAELVQPPVFSYGFYLPQTILIFIICVVYSVLRSSWQVLLAGLAYFLLGHFVYKYQLLYAMDHRQHSTGREWVMICDRVIVGLVVFQLTTAGQLILKQAVTRSVLMIPLLVATIWFSFVYSRTYKPLMRFIALRSVKRLEHQEYDRPPSIDETLIDPDANVWADDDPSQMQYAPEAQHRQHVDRSRETNLRFVNPSLIAPLKAVWIADKSARSNGTGRDLSGGDNV